MLERLYAPLRQRHVPSPPPPSAAGPPTASAAGIAPLLPGQTSRFGSSSDPLPEPSTMSELREAEDDEESDLILPPRFARRIWLVSWLALSSGSAAIANGRRDCAALSVLVLATSLNYWRWPTHGPRRTVDMAAAAGSLIYQVAAVAPFSHCPIAAGAYLASVAAGAGCYARARLLSRRHGDRDSSSWWHVGLHLCGNAGNVLLYDAVGRNLVGWRRR